jgi:hypothetical protein
MTHIKIWVSNMKTTIELSDLLFDQAKAAARAQGVTLKALIESGLRMAIHPKTAASLPVVWPDLSFHPQAAESGHLVDPSQWRDAVNANDWPLQK